MFVVVWGLFMTGGCIWKDKRGISIQNVLDI